LNFHEHKIVECVKSQHLKNGPKMNLYYFSKKMFKTYQKYEGLPRSDPY